MTAEPSELTGLVGVERDRIRKSLYNEANRELVRERNRERMRRYRRENAELDRLKGRERMRKYRRENAELVRVQNRERMRKYRRENAELVRINGREHVRKYRRENAELVRVQNRETMRRYRAMIRDQKSDARTGMTTVVAVEESSVSTDGQESGGERFKCQLCRFEFKREINLNKHYHNVHGVDITCVADNGFMRCDEDMKTMPSMSDCVKLEVQSCDVNEDIFNENNSELSRELGENFDYMSKVIDKTIKNKYNCDYNACREVFITRKQLTIHKVEQHLKAEQINYENTLKYISKLNDRVLKCIDCKESFSDFNQLKQHVDQSHGGYYVCDWRGCQYRTVCNRNYIQHNKRHIFGTFLVCKFLNCNYSSEDYEELLLHEKTAHIEVDLIGCQHKAHQNSTLHIHQKRQHTNYRPIACEPNSDSLIKKIKVENRDQEYEECDNERPTEIFGNNEEFIFEQIEINNSLEIISNNKNSDQIQSNLNRNQNSDSNERNERTERVKSIIPLSSRCAQVIAANIFNCDKCLKEFDGEHILESHQEIINNYLNSKCNYSGRLTDGYRYRLNRRCGVNGCDFQTSIIKTLKSHHRECHPSLRLGPINCEKCDFCCYTEYRLKEHVKLTHAEPSLVCDWSGCSYKTRNPTSLRYHCMRHSNDRPHVCQWPECGRGFVTKVTLDKHIKSVHTGDGIVECSQCGQRICEENLKDHIRRLHTDIRPFECDACPRRFAVKNDLNIHKSINHKINSDKEFECDECEYKTKSKHSLYLHRQRVHLKKRPIQCDASDCGKRFFNKQELKWHSESVHSEARNYSCHWPECKSAFKIKPSLVLHIKNKHMGGQKKIADQMHIK